uniref:Uncharacterized protein n=1 Tax=Aplanochytrium stocchinoi TaxID=215587 RepID=A0A7S3LNS9_9STRA
MAPGKPGQLAAYVVQTEETRLLRKLKCKDFYHPKGFLGCFRKLRQAAEKVEMVTLQGKKKFKYYRPYIQARVLLWRMLKLCCCPDWFCKPSNKSVDWYERKRHNFRIEQIAHETLATFAQLSGENVDIPESWNNEYQPVGSWKDILGEEEINEDDEEAMELILSKLSDGTSYLLEKEMCRSRKSRLLLFCRLMESTVTAMANCLVDIITYLYILCLTVLLQCSYLRFKYVLPWDLGNRDNIDAFINLENLDESISCLCHNGHITRGDIAFASIQQMSLLDEYSDMVRWFKRFVATVVSLLYFVPQAVLLLVLTIIKCIRYPKYGYKSLKFAVLTGIETIVDGYNDWARKAAHFITSENTREITNNYERRIQYERRKFGTNSTKYIDTREWSRYHYENATRVVETKLTGINDRNKEYFGGNEKRLADIEGGFLAGMSTSSCSHVPQLKFAERILHDLYGQKLVSVGLDQKIGMPGVFAFGKGRRYRVSVFDTRGGDVLIFGDAPQHYEKPWSGESAAARCDMTQWAVHNAILHAENQICSADLIKMSDMKTYLASFNEDIDVQVILRCFLEIYATSFVRVTLPVEAFTHTAYSTASGGLERILQRRRRESHNIITLNNLPNYVVEEGERDYVIREYKDLICDIKTPLRNTLFLSDTRSPNSRHFILTEKGEWMAEILFEDDEVNVGASVLLRAVDDSEQIIAENAEFFVNEVVSGALYT